MTARQKHPQATLRITQVRSRIGNQARVLRVLTDGLGLGRIGASVELPDNPCTRGMIAKVAHMVRVEELKAPASRRRGDDDVATAAEPSPAEVAEGQPPTTRRRRATAARGTAASEE